MLDRLRRQIDGHEFEPGAFVISETALANQEKISRMSVRRGVEILIREGKLERRPGKGLYVRQPDSISRLIQIVVPDITFPLCAEMARGIKQVALKVGVQAVIYDAHGDFQADLHFLRRLPKTAPHGAIIWSWHRPRFTEALYELKSAGYPFVLVDEAPAGIEVPTVMTDNYGGGYTVGQELIHRGHRRIAFIGFLGADTTRLRLEGLRDAISDAGLHFDRSLVGRLEVQIAQDWSAEIQRVLAAMLKRPDRPTALFFCNDYAAARGYGVIRDLGLRIPQDISVAGFDGDPVCELLHPRLATVRQPGRQLGIAAMQLLLALSDGSPMAAGSRMEATVVSRAACTPVATRDGSKENGHTDPQPRRHGQALDGPVAGRSVVSMETDAPIANANATGSHDSAWHRVLSVTWMDGPSVGPYAHCRG